MCNSQGVYTWGGITLSTSILSYLSNKWGAVQPAVVRFFTYVSDFDSTWCNVASKGGNDIRLCRGDIYLKKYRSYRCCHKKPDCVCASINNRGENVLGKPKKVGLSL